MGLAMLGKTLWAHSHRAGRGGVLPHSSGLRLPQPAWHTSLVLRKSRESKEELRARCLPQHTPVLRWSSLSLL